MEILFITANRVGDAILSTALLRELSERHPGARITLACGPAAAGLFAGEAPVETVHVLQKQSYARHWLALWRRLVGRRWDLVVDLRDTAVSRALWCGQRLILRPSRQPVHRVRHLAALLTPPARAAPTLWPGASHRAAAAAHLPRAGIALALGPTANWPGKQWPAARFAALLQRLSQTGDDFADAPIMVLGGPEERAAAAPVLAAIQPERRIDLVGRVDLLTAYACLARCRLYVGNDSGLMHLAAAAGTPTLGLFGPSRESLYAPWGTQTATVRGPRSYDDIVGAPDYDHRLSRSWMEDLSVDAVLAAAAGLLARSAGESAAG